MPIRVVCSDMEEADAVWRLIGMTDQPYSWEIHLAGEGPLAAVSGGDPSPSTLSTARQGHNYPAAALAAP